jgi:choline dehydrogenase-like flavoprotein
MTAGAIPGSEAVVEGCALPRGFDDEFDVVVVGSGSGGAVVAAHLAEAGRRVLVLEEGPYFTPEAYAAFSPTESIRRMWREAGMLAAFGVGSTPIIAIAVGRCVGGSSVLTGGVCFRIPSEVHRDWERALGLHELSEQALEPAYEDVERRMQISEVPADMRSYDTRKFVAGAASLGIPFKPIRRNVVGCQGNSLCNHGCPAVRKKSVDIAYLPSAFAHGARLVSDALVDQVVVHGGRAVGVVGHLIDRRTRGRRHAFRVRAPVVVLACGTLHTPLVMLRSRIATNRDALGSHVTLHPAVRILAHFAEPVDGHDGTFQSVYSDHFASEGLTLVGVHPAPNILAGAMPGIGPSHRARIRELPAIGSFGGMVHDQGGGSVRVGPSREPILWYKMAPRDLARVRRLITVLGEIAFASGAHTVYPPVFGVTGIHSVAELRRLEHEPLDARRIECMAFHPLGSARMSVDPRAGIVGPSGESHDIRGLYVADGSVLPTSVGVNSQVPILSIATRIAWRIRDDTQPVSSVSRSWWSRIRWQIPL